MRTTTTALAVGATALAIPATAHAQQSAVQAPLAGHLTVASQMREHRTELAQQRLTRKAWRLADKVAHARDRGFSPRAYRREIRDEQPARLARRVRVRRQPRHRHRQRVLRQVPVHALDLAERRRLRQPRRRQRGRAEQARRAAVCA